MDLAQSQLLLQFPKIIHGFTKKIHGDMNLSKDTQQQLLSNIGFAHYQLLNAKQIHGINVQNIGDTFQLHKKKVEKMGNVYVFDACDGLVMYESKMLSSFILGTRGADCCMILLVDPVNLIISTIHAGWKGSLHGIIHRSISMMKSHGSDSRNIYITIGPYIHACCYEVEESRALLFLQHFGKQSGVVINDNNTWYVDIGLANCIMAEKDGVLKEHIDCMNICTSCSNDYFSFRRDQTKPVEEQIGFIGFRN
jgi:polyphenol oxidase